MVFAIYPIEMGIITTGGSDRRSWSRERNKVSWGLDAANLFSPWVHCSLLDPVPNSVDLRKYCWELFFRCVDLRTDSHYTTDTATLISNLTRPHVLGNCDRDRTQPVKIILESIDIPLFSGD
jgi:hypothetical protein